MHSKILFIAGFTALALLAGCGDGDRLAGPNINFEDLTIHSLEMGHTHVCTRTNLGAYCWGSNNFGELGDDSLRSQPAPVQLDAVESTTQLSLGYYYSCGLIETKVKCWGWNLYGTLGNTSIDSGSSAACTPSQPCLTTTAVTVEGVDGGGELSGIGSISAGENHVCAINTDGGAYCWGENGNAQLGNGTVVDKLVPTQVSGLTSGVTKIESGEGGTTCAIVDGGAKCWGYNISGQVGDTTTTNPRATPTDVDGHDSGVTDIATGENHTCAIKGGAVNCWGEGTLGQMGNGAYAGINGVPDPTDITSGATAVAAGDDHTCAIVNGGVKCWGSNTSGQIGAGSNLLASITATPHDVVGMDSGVTLIAAGDDTSCAVKDNQVYCWGKGQDGQLGNNRTQDSTTPVLVETPWPEFLDD